MSKLDVGSKIQFRVPGDTTWYDGLVHGVKKGDSNGKEIILGYIVDTGNDERLDEWKTNQRDDAINERVNERLTGNETVDEVHAIVDDVTSAKDLPKSKIIKHSFRQPEQYEVTRDNIRLAE